MKQNIEIGKEFSAIILAAGKSTRMGFPKLSLKFNEHTIFIEHIANEYIKFGCKEIVLIVNNLGFDYLKKNKICFQNQVKIVINENPDWHRFYSLKLGAKSLSVIQKVFIHNVDNPFVNHEVLKELIRTGNKLDYISPEYKGKGGHPILLSENIILKLRSIEENQMHLKVFLNQFSKKKVSVDDKDILVNMNTLEEYKNYFSF